MERKRRKRASNCKQGNGHGYILCLFCALYLYLRLELKRSNGDCLREMRDGCSVESSGLASTSDQCR